MENDKSNTPLMKSLLKRYSCRGCDKSKELLRPKKNTAKKQRQFLENIWDKYSSYFETEIKASFYDFYAELITGYFLAEKQGYALCDKDENNFYENAQSKNHGPDFKVLDENIWVECISVEDIADNERIQRTLAYDQTLKDDQRAQGKYKNLMLMNPIRAKAKKYDRYIEDEIVGEEDVAIISVSLHKVDQKISKDEVKQSIKDVFEVFKIENIHGVLCFSGDFGNENVIFVKNKNNRHKKPLIRPFSSDKIENLKEPAQEKRPKLF